MHRLHDHAAVLGGIRAGRTRRLLLGEERQRHEEQSEEDDEDEPRRVVDDRRHDGKQCRAVEDMPRHQHLHEEDPLLDEHGTSLNDEYEKEPPRVERRRRLVGDEGADDAEEQPCGKARELHGDRLRHVVARRRDDRADGDEPKLHAVIEEEQDADDAGGNLQRA